MFLTIFTPTYNREALLKRLYESLCIQTNKDFEWLIVDDGSTDNTEKLVESFVSQRIININYIKKNNGGKHTAHNFALENAKGEYFFCVDSDDWLTEDSVANISLGVSGMKDKDYALLGYKTLENGKMLCSQFENEHLHTGFTKLQKMGIWGEFSIVMKLDIIKNYPFPVIEGEKFSTEAILYDYMELCGYEVYTFPQILTICEYQEEGLSFNGYKLLENNPTAYQIYNLQRIDLADSIILRLAHCIRYNAFCFMSNNKKYIYNGKHKKFVCATKFLAYPMVLYYKIKFLIK